MGTFHWDGEEFELMESPRRWLMAELTYAEKWAQSDIEKVSRKTMMLILVVISIRRRRQDLTFDRAAETFDLGTLVDLIAEGSTAKEVGEAEDPGVVLSPTSAGPVAAPRKARRSSATSAGSTPRRSRTSSASDPGKSTS